MNNRAFEWKQKEAYETIEKTSGLTHGAKLKAKLKWRYENDAEYREKKNQQKKEAKEREWAKRHTPEYVKNKKQRQETHRKTEEYKQKKIEYNDTLIQCPDCNEEMKRKHYQDEHRWSHTEEKSNPRNRLMNCPDCQQEMKTRYYAAHYHEHHSK